MSESNDDKDILVMWISTTSIESLSMCIREDGNVDIPSYLKPQLLECLRYSKSILGLYHIEREAYRNWLLILLDVVYSEIFNSRCFKALQQKDCKFRHLLDQLDSLFSRVDHQTFLSIG
ncbi:Hypothetical protein BPA_0047100 (plasmid) [Borrelia parkeri SLO]|uniref:Uncharacterized protein n=1 Tax=Borrelia parkeri SLO TaxID=1313294 RepID=W5SS40_BORPR|nr:hypothetical protein [Borrelia parkeri]AHH10014.1 Hypothetical protein BPA_0047100 [Borrelia parkeri SLO]UPA11447.1 hypothetical protein bpSLO_001302 [Borrelia parkeri]